MTENKFDAARHFDEKLSSAYDERIREIFPGYVVMHELAHHLLAESLKNDAALLIAGVGTGHETVTYARNKPGWKIVGFDPSPEMLAIAREKIDSLTIHENIELIHGTINDIRSDGFFDGATSILVMQFFPDNGEKQQYLQGISSRLRIGGRLIIIDLEGVKFSKDYHVLKSAWKAQQLVTRKDKKQIEKDLDHVDKHLELVSEERLRELLTASGFKNICKFYKSFLLGGYIAEKGE